MRPKRRIKEGLLLFANSFGTPSSPPNHLPSRSGSRAGLGRQRNLIKMHCQVVKVFELKKKKKTPKKESI